MTSALIGGDTAQADMERASRRQPEGSNFPTPVRQHAASNRPKRIEDTPCLSQHAAAQQDKVDPRRHSRRATVVARIRRNQITALLRHRCKGPCLTDDAIVFLEEILPLMAIACEARALDFQIDEWVGLNSPRLTAAEVADARARILPNPPKFTSEAIGGRLCVSAEEVLRLGLTHIRHVNWTKAKHTVAQRTKKAAAVKSKRLASGETKTPRERSILALKPWSLPGAPCASRREYYGMTKDAQMELTARARSAHV